MSRAIVGRIFWKEIRVQRAFWFWILLLGAFVQFVPRLLGRDWYMSALSSQWFLSVNIVVSCFSGLDGAPFRLKRILRLDEHERRVALRLDRLAWHLKHVLPAHGDEFARGVHARNQPNLSRRVRYRRLSDGESESALADIATHLCTHGMYHRGQIAAQAARVGLKCPPTDFIAFSRLAP